MVQKMRTKSKSLSSNVLINPLAPTSGTDSLSEPLLIPCGVILVDIYPFSAGILNYFSKFIIICSAQRQGNCTHPPGSRARKVSVTTLELMNYILPTDIDIFDSIHRGTDH